MFTQEGVVLTEMLKPLEKLSESEFEGMQCISRVVTHVFKHLTLKFVNNRFEWMLPVILSKSTDPMRANIRSLCCAEMGFIQSSGCSGE